MRRSERELSRYLTTTSSSRAAAVAPRSCSVTESTGRRNHVWHVWLLLIVTLFALVGCSNDSRSAGTEANRAIQRAAHPTTDAKDTADKPSVCADLANSKALSKLDAAIPAIVAGNSSSATSAAVQSAIASLESQRKRTGPALSLRIERGVAALRAINRQGMPNAQDVSDLVDAFATLGQEVQAQCQFPVR